MYLNEVKLFSDIGFCHERALSKPHQTLLAYVRVLLALGLVLVSGSCSNFIRHAAKDPYQEELKFLLLSREGVDLSLWAQPVVDHVYLENNYRPIWTDSHRIAPRGAELISLLSACEEYGLFPSDFHQYEIASINPDSLCMATSAKLDILLTDCFVLLLHQLRHGTLDALSMSTHRFTIADTVMIGELRRYCTSAKLRDLSTTEPNHFLYRDFKATLKRFLEKRDSFPNDHEILDDIDELYVNLERWRWEYQPFPDKHLFLNLASGRLYFFEHGQPAFCAEVIDRNNFHPLCESNAMAECIVQREGGDAEITIATKMTSEGAPRLWSRSSAHKSVRSSDLSSIWTQRSMVIKGGAALANLIDQEIAYGTNGEDVFSRPIPLFIRYYTFDQGRRYPDVNNLHGTLIQTIKNPPFSLEPDISIEPASPAAGGL